MTKSQLLLSLLEGSDDLWGLRDDYERQILKDLSSIKKTGKKKVQPWKVIPFARLKKVWNDKARTGIIRDTKAIDLFEDIITENILKLDINTEYMGHKASFPDDDTLEDYDLTEDDLANNDNIEAYFSDKNGAWRISDRIDSLLNLLIKLNGEDDYDQKLVIMDRILNTVHQRSDIASWFVEGGSWALSELSR